MLEHLRLLAFNLTGTQWLSILLTLLFLTQAFFPMLVVHGRFARQRKKLGPTSRFILQQRIMNFV
jgi:hypothetical protein